MSFRPWASPRTGPEHYIERLNKRLRTKGRSEDDPDTVNLEVFGREGKHHPGLVNMWREGRLCDATVQCDDGRAFKVHRPVLAVSSKFFQQAFEGAFSEAEGRTVQLQQVPSEAFDAAAEFMYTGKLSIDASSLVPMLDVSSFLQMAELQHILVRAIADRITPDTFQEAWQAADRNGLRSLEQALVDAVTSSVTRISTFACSPQYDSLPEPVLNRLGNHTDSMRKKTLRVLMVRDGSSSVAKLDACRRSFERLGGMEHVQTTIDKQARVELVYTPPPEVCGGGRHFELEFQHLFPPQKVAAGSKIHLETCRFVPPRTAPSFSSSLHIGERGPCYKSDRETFVIDAVRLARPPTTVRASPDGVPLMHYAVVLDVGMSFTDACQQLAISTPGEEPNEGFYRSTQPWHPSKQGPMTPNTSPLSLLTRARTSGGAPSCDDKGSPLYILSTPGKRCSWTLTGPRALQDFLDSSELVLAPQAEWVRLYEALGRHCAHGAQCGDGGGAPLPEGAGETVAGSSCMLGRRLRTIHLLTGDALVPLWALLQPKRIVSVRVQASDEQPASYVAPNEPLFGVWVDPNDVPKY